MDNRDVKIVLILLTVFVLIEWFGREGQYAIENTVVVKSKVARWSLYSSILLILYFLLNIL